ncbi:site-specific integrase [Pseudomonas veronii]|uniref:hypothetical protein n=1 Tax=Pseudomonas veronii TaxID=76761 RepID=UPI002D798C7E|nr:hypothetical protein [Pseudomonas veronii]WRU62674.1 hypothetical protein VPH48_31600 [Pseudomonas veronii]
MSEHKLPLELERFFRKTQAVKSEHHQPEWLMSEFEDHVWLIDHGVNTRIVNGVAKGGVRLTWSKKLSGGKLTDTCYKTVIRQAKMILVLAFDGAVPKFYGSLKTISGFHGFLFRLIEYLDIVYGDTFKNLGFEVLDAESVNDFMQLTIESGICGSGFFIERWESYLSGAGSSATDVESTKSYLRSMGAFNPDGSVSLLFIGAAIGVDAARLAKARFFKEYLIKYSLSSNQSTSRTIQNKTVSQLAAWFGSLANVLASSSINSSPDFNDPYTFNNCLKPFRGNAIGRTKTLPFGIAKKLISGCCEWMCEVFPELNKYLQSVLMAANDIRSKVVGISDFTAIKLAEEKIIKPAKLEKYYSDLFEGKHPLVSDHFIAPAFVMKLLQLQMAVSFVLITLLSCSRRSEIMELCEDDGFEVSGRCYLNVRLRKTGESLQRRALAKPVPKLVNRAIYQLRALKAHLSSYYSSTDPLVHTRLFLKVSQMGIGPMLKGDIYIPLRLLSVCLDLRDSSGDSWHVMPHQLRRFFALSFYHNAGVENSLPALSWFMGHTDIEGTWRYVKESLTGKEISASEAAMAASAVCSDDASVGAERLRNILCTHFGCSDLSLMKEEDVQDYLELLSEQGVYTATPVTIRDGRKKTFSILIAVKEGGDGSAS